MLTKEIALQFAGQWEKSWNSHDIERIISHYADDICLVSPIAGRIFGDPEVKGIEQEILLAFRLAHRLTR